MAAQAAELVRQKQQPVQAGPIKQEQTLPSIGPEEIELLRRRYDALKGSTERNNCESHWQQIAEVMSPRKVDFVGMRTPGEKRMSTVYDPTGIAANEMLAAGLHGMATNPASKWFSLRMIATGGEGGEDQNEEQPIREYLSHTEDVMWSRIYQPGTNFTTAMHEFYLDLGSFGTAVMFIGQRDDGGLLFETRSLAECVIAENADGRVDTVFRKCEYSVRQLMQMARSNGWEPSETVKDQYRDQKFDDKVCVIHAVYPRADRDVKKKNVENMPFASVYFEHNDCHLLKMGGFPEFPYLVGRWSKYASELYGRSPGMTALPDVKMLQAMVLTKIKLMQKAADPPMWLRDDGVVGQTRTVPGGINYWRGNPNDGVMLQPVSLQGLQFLAEDIKGLREQIAKTFYADMLRMTEGPDMTATEVVQRVSERMRLLGPLLGRLESEVLGPLVERIFGILSRLAVLPKPPKNIQGQDFTVEYVSPVAIAQKQHAASAVMQAMQLIAGSFGPDAAAMIIQKKIDPAKFVEWCWDLFNCDPDLLLDDEATQEIAGKEKAMQQIQAAQPMVDMAKQGASAVKDLGHAQSQGGLDIAGLISKFQSNVANDPRAQQEMQALSNGQQPDTAPPPPQ